VERVGDLRRRPLDELALGGPRRGPRPHLERARCQTLVHQPLRDHDLATVEQVVARGRYPHVRRVDADVGADLGKEQDLTLEGDEGVDDDRERFVVHDHELGRVLPLIGVLGEHRRDRFPDVAHDVGRQRAGHERRRER